MSSLESTENCQDKPLQSSTSQDFVAQAAFCRTPIGHSCCLHWERTNTAPSHLLVAAQVCLRDQSPHRNTTFSLVSKPLRILTIVPVFCFFQPRFVCVSQPLRAVSDGQTTSFGKTDELPGQKRTQHAKRCGSVSQRDPGIAQCRLVSQQRKGFTLHTM